MLMNASSTLTNCGVLAVPACMREMARSKSGRDLSSPQRVSLSSALVFKSSTATCGQTSRGKEKKAGDTIQTVLYFRNLSEWF